MPKFKNRRRSTSNVTSSKGGLRDYSEFEFGTLMTSNVVARVSEDRFFLKTFFRKWDVPLSQVRYLYAHKYPGRHGHMYSDDPLEVIITYENDVGKIKVMKFTAMEQRPLFRDFIHHLTDLKPEIDLIPLAPAAAFSKMQIMDPVLRLFGTVVIVLFVLLNAFKAVPLLLEAKGWNYRSFTPSQLMAMDVPETETVKVFARRLMSYDEARRSSRVCLPSPLADKTAAPDDPVTLLADFGCPQIWDPPVSFAQSEHRGTVRDINWSQMKGVSRKSVEKLEVKLAPRVKILSLKRDPQNMLMEAGGWAMVSCAGLLLGGLYLLYYKSRRKSSY